MSAVVPEQYGATPRLPSHFGPFDVTREIGHGGSGTVYAVTRDGVSLALKVLRSDLVLSSREQRRFLDEASRLRRLSHPAIVRLVETGTLDGGRPYLAMPLLHGETLAARLEQGELDLETAVRYFTVLADAVATMHRSELVHRDIKPENVILSRDDDGSIQPILLDLGIARDAGDERSTTTEQGTVRGTPAYMAPERFFGITASSATDVYELGVLLYMMLVGEVPWGSDDGAASRLHPRDPKERGVVLPEALSVCLLRALSTRPENRPSSAEAFSAEVRAVSATTSDPPPPDGARGTDRPTLPLWPVAATLLAALLAGGEFVRDAPASNDVLGGQVRDVPAPTAVASRSASVTPAAIANTVQASPAGKEVRANERSERGAARPVAQASASAPAPAPSTPSANPQRLYFDRR